MENGFELFEEDNSENSGEVQRANEDNPQAMDYNPEDSSSTTNETDEKKLEDERKTLWREQCKAWLLWSSSNEQLKGTLNLEDRDEETTESKLSKMTKEFLSDQSMGEKKQLANSSDRSRKTSKSKKYTMKYMETFCTFLENLVDNILGLDELTVINQYPKYIQNRLDRSVNELDLILNEIKASLINTERLKKTVSVVKKEISQTKKTCLKIRQQEINEMELVMALYDKDALRKWHAVKKSNSHQAISMFVNEMTGKRRALEFAIKMAEERLTGLERGNKEKRVSLFGKIDIEKRTTEDEDEPNADGSPDQ